MSGISRREQETIITFNQEDEEAELYTASPAIYRRMLKRGFKAEKWDEDSWVFKMPRQCVKLPSKPRVLTEKQKRDASERMKGLVRTKK